MGCSYFLTFSKLNGSPILFFIIESFKNIISLTKAQTEYELFIYNLSLGLLLTCSFFGHI